MAPLSLVTIHHEGAGSPSDFARGAAGGYTYWLGPNGFTRLRSPYNSYATLHFNHVSVDICLSGNRDNYDVTSADLTRLNQIGADARARGELVNFPLVRPHRLTFNTDCPGGRTMNTFDAIAAQFRGSAPPKPTPSPGPTPGARRHPTLAPGSWGHDVAVMQWELDVVCGSHLALDGMFGHMTQQTVFGFQAFFHLGVDGIVGPNTWALLDYCYDIKTKH